MEYLTIIVTKVVGYLESFGLIGGFLLIILESIIPALPLSVFIAFNILAFGDLLGIIISYFGTVTGCMLSFVLFRYVIKKGFYKIFNKKSINKVNKLMNKFTNIDFNILVLIMAMPFTPAFLVNIAGGLSNIKIKKFFFALLIGKIAMIYFWGYIGKNIIESLSNPIIIIKIIAIMIAAYLISKVLEKIVKVEE